MWTEGVFGQEWRSVGVVGVPARPGTLVQLMALTEAGLWPYRGESCRGKGGESLGRQAVSTHWGLLSARQPLAYGQSIRTLWRKKNSPSLKKRLEKYLTLCLEAGYSDSNVRHATFDWWHCEMSVSSFSTPYLWWTRGGDWFTSSHLPCACACITWIQHESCCRSVGTSYGCCHFHENMSSALLKKR